MAVSVTNIHYERVANQIGQNLISLQRDIVFNAKTHKAMAQAQSPALNVLQTFITDSLTQYRRRIQWVIDLRGNATLNAGVISVLATRSWTITDIDTMVASLSSIVTTLQSASLTSYILIASACDSVLTSLSSPISLWPE